jgi:hypothetical protein
MTAAESEEEAMLFGIVDALWNRVPEITIGLRFYTALIGFVIAVPLMVRQIRRWLRRHRRR